MNKEIVFPLVAGLGAGAVVGYVVGSSGGIGKPKITVSGSTWTYSGFPPNVRLMSMGGGTGGIGSAPLSIGQTGVNGTLVITGAPTIPAGNTVLYVVFVANHPDIYATTVVTS